MQTARPWGRSDIALLGALSRPNAGAHGLSPHQLGPLRPRHLRHHDGNDLAPERAGAVRAVRIFGSITSKEQGCITIDERAEAQKACFPAALDWMLVNYAYYTGAFIGKGG